jgi:hypothetical protein
VIGLFASAYSLWREPRRRGHKRYCMDDKDGNCLKTEYRVTECLYSKLCARTALYNMLGYRPQAHGYSMQHWYIFASAFDAIRAGASSLPSMTPHGLWRPVFVNNRGNCESAFSDIFIGFPGVIPDEWEPL